MTEKILAALKTFQKINKPFASLKLAVFIIASTAVLISVGTFVEAKLDAQAAAKLVYKTPWMYTIMALLAINLTAVMIDRLPWKTRHMPFVFAHIGILVLLLGSVITMNYGIDGNVRIPIGGTNSYVTLPETQLNVWASFDATRYEKVFARTVDFYLNSPKKKPIEIPLLTMEMNEKVRIVDYEPYALPSKKIQPSNDEKAGAGLRFQFLSSRINMNDWLIIRRKGESSSKSLGPADVHFGVDPLPRSESNKEFWRNELFITETKKDAKTSSSEVRLNYTIRYRDPAKKQKTGEIKEFEKIATGWMDIEFQILKYLPKAEEKWEFQFLKAPTPLTSPVIQYEYHDGKGKVTHQWSMMNDIVKFFSQNAVFVVSYGNLKWPLGFSGTEEFELRLKDFKVGRYPGTMRAASYESEVEVFDIQSKKVVESHHISMNEPMKYNGMTFYQASFQDGPDGRPEASILSVNYDPGRWLKYAGSLIMVMGIVWLFINKRKTATATLPKNQEEIAL